MTDKLIDFLEDLRGERRRQKRKSKRSMERHYTDTFLAGKKTKQDAFRFAKTDIEDLRKQFAQVVEEQRKITEGRDA